MEPATRQRKPNPFNDSARKRKIRTVIPSPWASREMKRQRTVIAQKYGSLPVSEKMRISARFLKNPESFSDSDVISFLEANHKHLKSMLVEDFGDRPGLRGFNKEKAQLFLEQPRAQTASLRKISAGLQVKWLQEY